MINYGEACNNVLLTARLSAILRTTSNLKPRFHGITDMKKLTQSPSPEILDLVKASNFCVSEVFVLSCNVFIVR
jgi:hypothetical protein